ncbi:MAG: PqqD family protein [Phycisphaerae bacterium]
MLLSPAILSARRRDDLICHELGKEAVVYDDASNTLYSLNETSYFVWRRWGVTPEIEAVTRQLTEVFDVSEDHARADVRKTIAQMLENGLLEPAADRP